jgi:hypothetical protein
MITSPSECIPKFDVTWKPGTESVYIVREAFYVPSPKGAQNKDMLVDILKFFAMGKRKSSTTRLHTWLMADLMMWWL